MPNTKKAGDKHSSGTATKKNKRADAGADADADANANANANAKADAVTVVAEFCSICLDPKKDPVTVKCGHSFCGGCYEGLKKSTRPGRVTRCPLCRTELNGKNSTLDNNNNNNGNGNNNNNNNNNGNRNRNNNTEDAEVSGPITHHYWYFGRFSEPEFYLDGPYELEPDDFGPASI